MSGSRVLRPFPGGGRNQRRCVNFLLRYILRRAREDFRKEPGSADSLEKAWREAQDLLTVVRRQSVLYSQYSRSYKNIIVSLRAILATISCVATLLASTFHVVCFPRWTLWALQALPGLSSEHCWFANSIGTVSRQDNFLVFSSFASLGSVVCVLDVIGGRCSYGKQSVRFIPVPILLFSRSCQRRNKAQTWHGFPILGQRLQPATMTS